jgi:hypothetical protein
MIVVIVVLVVVIVPIVASAILYVMVSGLIGGDGTPPRPYVAISLEQGGSDPNSTANLTVTGVSTPYSFSEYRMQISMDGNLAGSHTPSPGVIVTFGGAAEVIVIDRGTSGRLDTGDIFRVFGLGGAHTWRFAIVWASDGTTVQTATWATP